MKRKELRAYLGVTVWNGDKDHDADVYVKSLADSVMDEYEENIKELNKQLEDAENAYYSLKMDTENRIKELEQTHNLEECPLRNENRELKKRIEELEATIFKMETPGWVSVKDRLPKESDKGKFGLVLVMTLDGTCYTSEFDPEAIDPYGTNDDYRWFTGDIFLSNVTHWMPLPPPPKEEGK